MKIFFKCWLFCLLNSDFWNLLNCFWIFFIFEKISSENEDVVEVVGFGKQMKEAKTDASEVLLEELKRLKIRDSEACMIQWVNGKHPSSVLNEFCQKSGLKGVSFVFKEEPTPADGFSCYAKMRLPRMMFPRGVMCSRVISSAAKKGDYGCSFYFFDFVCFMF